MDRQRDRQTDTKLDRQTNEEMDRQRDRQTDTKRDRQANEEMDRQRDRQTDMLLAGFLLARKLKFSYNRHCYLVL